MSKHSLPAKAADAVTVETMEIEANIEAKIEANIEAEARAPNEQDLTEIAIIAISMDTRRDSVIAKGMSKEATTMTIIRTIRIKGGNRQIMPIRANQALTEVYFTQIQRRTRRLLRRHTSRTTRKRTVG